MGCDHRWRKTAILSASVTSLTLIIVFASYFTEHSFSENVFQLIPLLRRSVPLSYGEQISTLTVQEMQRRRRKLLAEMCAKYFPAANKTTKGFPLMFSSDNQRFLYCYVPKVACTSWKGVLSRTNGAPEGMYVHSGKILRYLDQFTRLSSVNQRRVLKNYFKFMFVRHPFERLVSAYFDKFIEGNLRGFKNIAKSIIGRHRTNDSQGPVTFREFALDIIRPRNGQTFNRHWQPYHKLCQPCRIGFDFIGHYETLADDSRYVLDHLGIASHFPRPKVVHNSSSRVGAAFSQLTEPEIRQILEIYRLDFALFGYSTDISEFLNSAKRTPALDMSKTA